MTFLYFEDFEAGQVYELGEVRVSREDILDFARRFDPQWFHLDEERAKDSIYGGLIASGWHTGSLMMRLLAENLLNRSASLGSPGLSELSWLAPVRPGDRLRTQVTIVSTRASRSKPERGSCECRYEMFNQDGVLVLRAHGIGMFGRRPDER